MLAAAATDHRRLKRKSQCTERRKRTLRRSSKESRMAKTVDSADAAGKPALKRVIGRGMLLCFVVGDILGAGIYALVGKVAGHVGGMLWLPFLLAFALASLTAAAYAELVGKYSRASGAALYVHQAFGVPFVTFIVAFAVMISGITSASAASRASAAVTSPSSSPCQSLSAP